MPRNLVNNALPRRFLGNYAISGTAKALNFGEDPIWLAGQFTPDTTPSSVMSWRSNSKSQAWPFGGVSPNTARNSSVLDVTYFGAFAVDKIDAVTGLTVIPLFGQGSTSYGNNGQNNFGFQGLGLWINNGLVYLCYIPLSGSGFIINTDVTGATPLCQLTAGHWYFASISISISASDNFCRFYLYDYTASSLISVTGNQYFTNNLGNTPPGANLNNQITVNFQNYNDFSVYPGIGAAVRMRLCGCDNQVWDTTIGFTHNLPPVGILPSSIPDYMRAAPYVTMTATVNTSGTPPTDLTAASNSNLSQQYQTAFVASSSVSGAPASLPAIAIGDAVLSRATNLALEFSAVPPIGAPHSISTWKLYECSVASYPGTTPPIITGSPVVTSSTLPLSYTPADTAIRYYQVTATDSVGTVYVYQIIPAALRSRATVRMMIGGNSVLTDTGNYQYGIQTVGAFAQAVLGCDCAISSQAIDSTSSTNWLTGASTKAYFGQPSGNLSMLDWFEFYAADELSYTGNMIDWVVLQFAGNSATTTTAQYTTICSDLLAGTGLQASYTPAISKIDLAFGLYQWIGHPVGSNAQILQANVLMAAAANNTTIFATGGLVQSASVNYQVDVSGGHPDPAMAAVEGIAWLWDL